MNILAFVDTHEDPDVFARFRRLIEQESVDVVCCMGDFTIFGRQTEEMLQELDGLGVPVVLIHGNHEDEEEVLRYLEGCENIRWAHGTFVELAGVKFFGFGGRGFSRCEPELERFEEEHADEFDERTIVMSHAPPYETTLDEVDAEWHVGNASLRDLLVRRRPMLCLCGHIHQCFHERDTVGGTLCINPGPDGEIIEVDV